MSARVTRWTGEHDCYYTVRALYHVPAYIGVRVTVDGRHGVIVETTDPKVLVNVLLDGETTPRNCDPVNNMSYTIDMGTRLITIDVDPVRLGASRGDSFIRNGGR